MSDRQSALVALLEVMARLRDPQQGCPWDREQTFESIAPYTLEEAYEVADAIASGDPRQLRDELGDLLFQVVFHSRMAQERGWFDFDDVAAAIRDKLLRRHPHVFEAQPVGSAAEQSAQWEEHKERERAARSHGGEAAQSRVLADVPRALPALTRAAKLGKRVARVGFDWPDVAAVREKLIEELRELDAALGRSAPVRAEVEAELGDLLFTVVNLSRHLRMDPETALQNANTRFERRFEEMERLAHERGYTLSALSAAQWDALWREAKERLASA